MLAVSTADTTLLHAGMESLHGFEVLAVDISLAKLQASGHLGSGVDILGENG